MKCTYNISNIICIKKDNTLNACYWELAVKLHMNYHMFLPINATHHQPFNVDIPPVIGNAYVCMYTYVYT